jgi:hypothetical protein
MFYKTRYCFYYQWNVICLQAIYISRVVDGGIAQRDGKIKVGDKLLSVSINILISF